MASYQVKQSSTAYPLVFFMTDSSDHISKKTGLSPTVTISKNGGSFGSPAGAVTELAVGWYKIAGNATDTGTLGPIILHSTATGADDTDVIYECVAHDVQDAVHLGLSALPNTACTTNASLLTSGTGTDQLSVATGRIDIGKVLGTAVTLDSNNVLNVSSKYLAGTALTGRDIGASVLLSTGTGTGQLDFTSGVVKANATQWLGGTIPAVNVTGVPLVDVKYFLGTISPATAGYAAVDWGQVTNKTTTNALTGTTISTSQAVASVSGAVGSVTAAVTLSASDSPSLATGTATAGAASTITLQTALGADSLPNGCIIKITSGTGAKQARVITGYVDATKVTTVDHAWTTNPDSTSVYTIVYTDSAKTDANLAVTAGTVSDKTGYSLSQAFPTNFSSLSIDSSGRIDVGKTLGTAVTLDSNSVLNVSSKYLAGTALTGRDIGASVLLSTGSGTGQLDFTSGVVKANATQWLGGTIPAVNVTGVPLVDVKYFLGTISPATAGYAAIDWGQVTNKTTTNALTGTTISTAQVAASVTAAVSLSAGDSPVLSSGTATAGASTTITLQTALGADSLPNGCTIKLTGGTGAKQARVITGYVDATKVTTVDRAWTTNPDATSVYTIVYNDTAKIDSSLAVTAGTVSDKTGYSLSQSFPTNFATLSIDGSGRIDVGKTLGTAVTLDTNNVLNVSAKYLAGTTLTGRDIGASVLLSAGSGTGQLDFTSGVVKANATQWLGGTIPAVNVTGVPLVDVKYFLGTISPAAAGYAAIDWGQVTNKTTTNALTGTTISTAQVAASVTAAVSLSAGDSPTLSSGTATAGGASTITLQTALGADNLPNGCTIKITSGTGAKQARVITGYVDSTKVTTVDRAWTTNPDATSVYTIVYGDAAKKDSNLAVTAGTVSDKTGYSLSQSFPTNFSSLSIDGSGRVDIAKILGTASAGTAGYVGVDWGQVTNKTTSNALTGTTISTSQVAASVTAGVTVTTNNDKTGYSLTQTFPTNFSSLSIDSNGLVKIQSGFTKNTAFNNFEFPMRLTSDHVSAATGLTVVVQRSIDGAAFANATNTPATEIANGAYKINLSAADLNGNNIMFRMTAATADDLLVSITTTP